MTPQGVPPVGVFDVEHSWTGGFVAAAQPINQERYSYYQSADGISWTALPGPPASAFHFTSEGALLAGAVSGEGSTRDAIVWSWSGSSWDALDEGPIDLDECGVQDLRNGAYFYGSGDTILISLGKAQWTSTPEGWACVPGAPNLSVAGGHDVFVGSGSSSITEPESLWFSTDGTDWRQTQPLTAFLRVVVVDGGFVALDDNGRFESADTLFASLDGEHWTEQDSPFASSTIGNRACDGERAVIIQYYDAVGDESPGVIWISSTDGTAWTRYSLPVVLGDAVNDVAILGERIVATGWNSRSDTPGPLIWVADIP